MTVLGQEFANGLNLEPRRTRNVVAVDSRTIVAKFQVDILIWQLIVEEQSHTWISQCGANGRNCRLLKWYQATSSQCRGSLTFGLCPATLLGRPPDKTTWR